MSEHRTDESGKFPDHSADESTLSMLQVAGGREHDSTTSGADEHDPNSTQIIVAEWIERSRKRPPANVIGQTAKLIAQMLAEGIDPNDVRRGMGHWMAKGLHPSSLPSVVNEVMNAAPVTGRGTAKAQGWLNVDQQQVAIQGAAS